MKKSRFALMKDQNDTIRPRFKMRLTIQATDNNIESGPRTGQNKETFTYLGRAYSEKKDWQRSIESFEKGEPTSRDLLTMGQMYTFMNQPHYDLVTKYAASPVTATVFVAVDERPAVSLTVTVRVYVPGFE